MRRNDNFVNGKEKIKKLEKTLIEKEETIKMLVQANENKDKIIETLTKMKRLKNLH